MRRPAGIANDQQPLAVERYLRRVVERAAHRSARSGRSRPARIRKTKIRGRDRAAVVHAEIARTAADEAVDPAQRLAVLAAAARSSPGLEVDHCRCLAGNRQRSAPSRTASSAVPCALLPSPGRIDRRSRPGRRGNRPQTMPFWLSLTKTPLVATPRHRRDGSACRTGRNASNGCVPLRVEGRSARRAHIGLDRRDARRTIGRDPQELTASDPRRSRTDAAPPAGSSASGRSCGRRGSGGRGRSTPRWSSRQSPRLQPGDV